MKKLVLLFGLLLAYYSGLAQDIPQRQLEIAHDNDFFLTTDRYYSSGLFLTYRRIPKKGLFSEEGEQFSLRLGQQVYTPSDVMSRDTADYDRPYAGLSGLWATWSKADQNQLLEGRALLGRTGPSSRAGSFQRWYHNNIVIYLVPAWEAEIADAWQANLYVRYLREWKLAPNPFGVRIALSGEAAWGSLEEYIQPEVAVYLGRRGDLNTTIGHQRLGSLEREIFMVLRGSYRRLGHNSLIEGNRGNSDSPFTTEALRGVWQFGFDFNHRYGRNDYKVVYRIIGKETPDQSRFHQYIGLAYALAF